MERDGILFIISAPSGAGKTSLCNEIIDIFPDLRHSVSYTTRSARPGEKDGTDYFFVSVEQFRQMVDAGEFAEWAEVHGNLYGTSLKTLSECRSRGVHVVLDIDCQGARQLKACCDDAVFIFILPPDLDELRRRLVGRNSDSAEVVDRRMRVAVDEVQEAAWYDYVIVNDVFDRAVEKLRSVIIAEQSRTSRVLPTVAGKFSSSFFSESS